MSSAIRVGKLFGVELALDRSSGVLFAFIVWSLSSVFQAWHPSWTTGTVITVSLVTGLAFFASLLVHELAHALVAKAYGLPVRDITLHIFGGAASLERQPRTPGAELMIALVGPIASVGLGAAMVAISMAVFGSTLATAAGGSGDDLTTAMSRIGPTETLLLWLGPTNLVLGMFNLVPAFPMDGGRALRAILWKATGNLHTATRWSTAVGQAFGVLVMVMGGAMVLGARVPFFGTGLVAGVWIAFIGLFLRGSAKRQQARTDAVDALAGVPVASLMRAGATGVPANTSIHSLAEIWSRDRDEGVLPVLFNDRLVGVVAITDLSKVRREEWDDRTAREVMRAPADIPTISPSDPAIDALQKVEATGLHGLPVVDVDGALVGMLLERDVARWVALNSPQTHPGRARPRYV